MPKYTPLCISRWIVLGPRRWVWLLLIVGLVVAVSFPTVAEPPSVWVWPDERGWFWQRPSRVGRWVWRVWQVMWASRWSLMCRVGLLAGLVAASGMAADCPRLGQVVWLPVVEWVLGVLGWAWPRLGRTQRYRDVRTLIHAAYLVSVVGLGLVVTVRWASRGPASWVLGSVVCERDSSRVELEAASGSEGRTTYRARLSGEFVIEVTPRDEFEKRLFILTLRHASRRTPGHEGSRWGIVRQEDLAQVFEVFQEHISRWQAYVREGQWAQLLSVSDKSLLTDDLRQQIVEVWAANIWQTASQVWERLAQQGVAVTERLVQEAGRQSGLMKIRARLKEQFIQGPDGLRPREGYVTEQLFKLVEQLQAQAAPCEDTVDIMALRQIVGAAEPAKTLEKPWRWLFRVEHWLFGEWQLVDEGTVRCALRHCGSEHVPRKTRKPRLKAYLDEQGQRQTVEVYRYYCKNPDCPFKTFTSLPPNLIAYSVWTLDARVKALELP